MVKLRPPSRARVPACRCVQPALVGGVHVDIVAGGAVGDREARWETNVAGARGAANAVTMPAFAASSGPCWGNAKQA